MTDIKEAQGLEVFTVPGRYLAVNRKNPGAQDVVLLSGATAVIDQQAAELAYFGEQELHLRSVIDQLREQVEYTEGMYATALEIVDELREELNKPKMDANISLQLNQQLREQVAELERAITSSLPCSYYMDLPDGGYPSLEEQLRRMAEDAANLRIAELRLHEVATHCATVEQELAAIKSAPVVMPERSTDTDWLRSNDEYNEGWNDCLDEVARLNRSKTNEQ